MGRYNTFPRKGRDARDAGILNYQSELIAPIEESRIANAN